MLSVARTTLRSWGDPLPPARVGRRVASADVARALSIEQLWDAIGARLDGPRAGDTRIVIAWHFTDVDERWTVKVENGALSATSGQLAPDAHTTVTLTRAALDALMLGEDDAAELFSSGAFVVLGGWSEARRALRAAGRRRPGFRDRHTLSALLAIRTPRGHAVTGKNAWQASSYRPERPRGRFT